MTKKLILLACVSLALMGCKDRVIWNDNGKVEEATENREVWDTKGKMDGGERKIWNDQDGDPVVK
ncbi:MAG: hypothetical protein R3295_03530 [Marinobacter sp.]|nr:hypothetical protein [Marinobacter sp.]